MIRKGFIGIICLMLIIFSFSAAMAEETETVTTITCEPGTLLSGDETLTQICDSASIRLHSLPSGSGALVLSLNEVDVLTNLIQANEDGFYLQSDILGSDILYCSWEDIAAFVKDQLENNKELESLNAMLGEAYQPMIGSAVDGDSMEAQMQGLTNIDDDMTAFIKSLEDSQVVETGTFALKGSDLADTKTTITLTKEDMVAAVELPFVREQIAMQLTLTSPELTEEEVNAQVEQALAEVKTAITESDLSFTATLYTANEAFVAMEIAAGGVADEENAGIYMTVTKTSIADAAFYQINLRIFIGEEHYITQDSTLYLADNFASGSYTLYSYTDDPVLTLAFNCDLTQSDAVSGEITATLFEKYFDEPIALLLTFDQTRYDAVTDTKLALYMGSALDEIKAALPDSSVLALNFHTVTQPDSGFFSALQNATPETSVQLLQMSEEELNAYSADLEQSVTMAMLTVLSNLPPDVSNAMMENMEAN